MTTVAIIFVSLTNQGYWIGGQEGVVRFQLAAGAQLQQVAVEWQLHAGDATLDSGRLALPAADESAALKLVLPEVRVPTDVRLTYRVIDTNAASGQAKELTRGEATIHLYPNNLTQSLTKILADCELIVWDDAMGLPTLLDQQKVAYDRIDAAAELAFRNPDFIIVGRDRLDDSSDQNRLVAHARAGSNVLIMAQSRVARLAGYRLVSRADEPQPEQPQPNDPQSDAPKFHWRTDHSLGRRLRSFAELLGAKPLRPVQLPADEADSAIAYWRKKADVNRATQSVETLLVAKAIGKGQLVLCQLPFGRWQDDPRSQLFLVDAVSFLLSRNRVDAAPDDVQRSTNRPAVPRQPASNILDSFSGELR